MNQERRKQITAARHLVLEAFALFDRARNQLETIRDDEQAYRDAMPDSIGDSAKGWRADEVIENLDDAISQIEEFRNGTLYDVLDEAGA
jgi:ATP-dependent protease HslVU (ClpYQ) peptidase subunit